MKFLMGIDIGTTSLKACVFDENGIMKRGVIVRHLVLPTQRKDSLAILNDIFTNYGVDSYVGRSASVIVGSCDTVFYVTTLYCSQTKVKKLLYAVPVGLIATLIGAIVSCLICKVL